MKVKNNEAKISIEVDKNGKACMHTEGESTGIAVAWMTMTMKVADVLGVKPESLLWLMMSSIKDIKKSVKDVTSMDIRIQMLDDDDERE